MQISATAPSEEAAIDAIWQREHFPIGTTANLIACEQQPDDLRRYTFDFTVPFGRPVWSMPHPYEDAPVPVNRAHNIESNLAVTGYAAMHAPSQEAGQKIGYLAMFIRTFDRHGGAATIRHYRGCMTGGPR